MLSTPHSPTDQQRMQGNILPSASTTLPANQCVRQFLKYILLQKSVIKKKTPCQRAGPINQVLMMDHETHLLTNKTLCALPVKPTVSPVFQWLPEISCAGAEFIDGRG